MKRKPNTTARRSGPVATLSLLVLAAMAFAGAAVANDDDGHHGFRDDDPAGQIASFDPDSGVLVIDLAAGGSISGLVTRRTWIKTDHGDGCEARRQKLHSWCRHRLSGDDHGWPGWRHGRGDVDDLVPGTTVEDALLMLKDGRAFFWKVELDD